MKKLILILLLFQSLQHIHAQAFRKTYNNQAIPHNGYYFKGKLLVSPTNDNGIVSTGRDNLGHLNVTKMTDTGCVAWSYSYDFGTPSVGSMVKQLVDGNYLVGGNFNSDNNAVLLKITSSGTVLWSRRLNLYEYLTDFAQSGSTLMVVTGQAQDSSVSSIVEIDEPTGSALSIKKASRTPIDGFDTSVNCHFNRIVPVPFGGYLLAGNMEYTGPPYRKGLLLYLDPIGTSNIFKVFSSGTSVDDLILQPFGEVLIALENQDYLYSPAFPNAYSRMTLIKMNPFFGSVSWQKFYVPPVSIVSYVAQQYPNSIVQTNSGDLLICGVADQGDGSSSINYIFKTDSSGNVIGNMRKTTATGNSGITSIAKTTVNDYIATCNGRGMMRFTDNLDDLCETTVVPFTSNIDTVTSIESETGIVDNITDTSVVDLPMIYAASENVVTVCGNECLSLPCQNSSTSNLLSGLLAYYPFGQGSLSDYSGNAHHLTNTTTAHAGPDRNSNPNCAFEFNNMPYSNNEFLSTNDTAFLNGLGDYSVSLWYKPTETPLQPSRDIGTYETLIGRDYLATVASEYYINAVCPDRTGQWTVGLYDCRYAVFGAANSVWQTYGSDCNIAPNTGQWHHLTAVYNQAGPTMKLYRDGVLQGNPAGTIVTGDLSISDCLFPVPILQIGDLFLGKNYTGLIDDVFIHNRELSMAEVNQLYNLGSSCCSDDFLGLDEFTNEKHSNIKIFPNPTSGILNIDTPEKVVSMALYDMEGRLVLSQKTPNKIFDISKMKSGTYLLKITTMSGTEVQKIIKK